MDGDMRRSHGRLALREERGQVLALVAGSMVAILVIAAFVIDVGHVYWAKRALQRSADAAALAGASKLGVTETPPYTTALNTARTYSGGPGRLNFAVPGTHETTICTPAMACGQVGKIIVEERATVNALFARVVGIDTFNVTARAVASATITSTPTPGPPLAIFARELCGNKGFSAGGDNMRIEGGIHTNGNYEVKNPGFVATSRVRRYRPPHADSPSPPGPTQNSSCKNDNGPGAVYEAGLPAPGPWRDWVTPYTNASLCGPGEVNCTYNWGSADRSYTAGTIPPGIHCTTGKFEISGSASGNITVIAEIITVGGSGTLTAFHQDTSTGTPLPGVLLFSTGGPGTEVILNPSGPYSWTGYIINKNGNVKVNASSVTSPLNGLLEGISVEINGANFRMLGTYADPDLGGSVTTTGPPQLDE
jgi:Flp pilus assembly protein TadG